MTEVIKIKRAEMINQLVQSMMDAYDQDGDLIFDALLIGHKGYSNYTDDELIQEYRDYVSQDPNADIEIQLEK